MKKTQEKILANAIKLFNRKGVSNARLQDIAKEAGISPGNLSYHYRLKKDLMEAVLVYMEAKFRKASSSNMAFIEENNYLSLIKNYLRFQIEHRFFYRDTLEVITLTPKAKVVFDKQMQQVQNFTRNGLYLAVGKGIVVPEPHEGHYAIFARNIWAILNSWLAEREVLGKERISLSHIMLALWEFHYPYLTEEGRELFYMLKDQLPELIEKERKATAATP